MEGIAYTIGMLGVGLAIWLGLTYWVYTDAKRRGSNKAAIHAVGTLTLGAVYAIVYAATRS